MAGKDKGELVPIPRIRIQIDTVEIGHIHETSGRQSTNVSSVCLASWLWQRCVKSRGKGRDLISLAVHATQLAAFVILPVALCGKVWAQAPASSGISLPTQLRVQASGWWPTKGEVHREDYVGTEVCAGCHALKAQSYRGTAMGHASSLAADAEQLRNHDRLVFQEGPYHSELSTQGGKSTLAVQGETSSYAMELRWSFGAAHMGQTYIFEQNGSFYESRLSFYAAPGSLDITPGQARNIPKSLEAAAGRKMSSEETHKCFGCHMTASTSEKQFDASLATPGVTCEACHGPGAKHVAAVRAGTEKRNSGSILNPLLLEKVDSTDFCGACHRTWEDVVQNHLTGIGVFNVRFAPYRLENSRCWKNGDARITCIACHDPHKPLQHDLASYDANCLECHVRTRAKRTAGEPASCPVSTKNCVSCHMPTEEPPNLHSTFRDHWIRVVKPKAPYTN